MFVLPQSRKRNIIYSSYNNVHYLVGNYFAVEQKQIQYLNMLTHDEYMRKLTTISISSFNLIEESITIPVEMVLCTNEKCSGQ